MIPVLLAVLGFLTGWAVCARICRGNVPHGMSRGPVEPEPPDPLLGLLVEESRTILQDLYNEAGFSSEVQEQLMAATVPRLEAELRQLEPWRLLVASARPTILELARMQVEMVRQGRPRRPHRRTEPWDA